MSDFINQLPGVGSMSFEDAYNTAAYIGMATLPVITGVAVVDYFRTPKTNEASSVGADPELLDQVVAEEKDGRFKSRAGKWGTWLLVGAGATVASVSLLDPQIEYETTLPGVETLAVIDSSYTMANTADMTDGATRLSSVFDAFTEASKSFPTDLKAGVVLFGSNAMTTSPLTTDRGLLSEGLIDVTTDENGIERPVVDPNGGDISTGVQLGIDILSGSENIGGETLFLFTDGTVEKPETAVASIIKASENGTNVVVVVPGTEVGSYTRSEYDPNPIDSGVDTSVFNLLEGAENVEVILTNDSAELQEIIEDRVSTQTISIEKRPTNLFTIAGASIAALGILSGIRKTWKRKV